MSRTYHLPGSDVEVEIDYTMSPLGPVFDAATIGGVDIDTDSMFYLPPRAVSDPRQKPPEQISLTQFFQNALDEDAEDIEQEEKDGALEAARDEREGR